MKTARRQDGRTARSGGRKVGWVLFALAVLPSCRLAVCQETSVTVYSDGRLLVRRTIPVAVARGVSTVVADLGVREADPASFVSLDSSVQIRGVRVYGATGVDGSLRRSLGSEVVFRVGPDSAPRYLRGTLLSLEPPAVRTDGYVLYGMPGTPVFPDSMVQLLPRVEVTVDAARAANGLRLMYLSNGLSWAASYAVMLPRGGVGQAAITGTAQIDNGGAVTLPGAQVQLLAGTVRRVQTARPMAMRQNAMEVASIMVDAGEPSEEALGGTRLYTLPGTVDFAPGETRNVALFARTAAAVEPEFMLRNPSYGATDTWPDALRDLHPDIGYRVRRPAASPFGATPLPGGAVRVYEPDESGRPQLVGEATIAHTPPGRDVRVITGTAFDVTVTRTQTTFERRGTRETVSGYRVDLQNAKAQAIVVQVMDQCPGRCEILSSSVGGEQPAVGSVVFRVTVPANGSATLSYQLRARW
jgi:hypothetical protein